MTMTTTTIMLMIILCSRCKAKAKRKQLIERYVIHKHTMERILGSYREVQTHIAFDIHVKIIVLHVYEKHTLIINSKTVP